MRLGISSYTYVWAVGVPGYPQPERPLTAVDLLAKAVDLGVHVLQIADNVPLNCSSKSELDELSRQTAELGIELELGTSGLRRETLLAWLELATRLKSRLVRVVIDQDDDHPTPDEAVQRLSHFLPEFERADVILAIENHDRFPAVDLLGIVERVQSEHIGICLDTANSIGCLESVDRVIDILGSHVVNVHIKDYCLFRPPHNKGFIVEGRPAGKGQLDIPRLLERVRSYGRDPNVIIELWPPPQSTLEESICMEQVWATESVRYLRQFIHE